MVLQNALGNIALDATVASTNTLLGKGIDTTTGLEKMKVGTVQGRAATNFSGASMPQDGFSTTATGSGHTVTLAGAANGARYLNVATGTTINTTTTVECSTVVTMPTRVVAQLSMSQRIANQEVYLELCGVDGSDVIQEDATGPLNWIALKFDSTTAANGILMVRSGGNSVYSSSSVAFGTTVATGTGPNFIPATSYDLLAMAERVVASGFAVNALTAGAGTVAATINLPVPTTRFKFRLRVKNLGTAPASTTDVRLHQVRILDQARLTAELTGGIVRADAASSIPVVTNGTTTVSGTVGVTGYPTAAAAADAYANPTITHLGADEMNFNGATWDRRRNNVNVNVDTSAAKTTTVAGTTAVNYNATGMFVSILVTAVSGTTPTLVAKLQWSPDNGTTWVDWDTTNLQTASISTTGTYTLKVYPGATNTANSSANGTVPRTWRVYYTIGGTTPSFTLASWAAYSGS